MRKIWCSWKYRVQLVVELARRSRGRGRTASRSTRRRNVPGGSSARPAAAEPGGDRREQLRDRRQVEEAVPDGRRARVAVSSSTSRERARRSSASSALPGDVAVRAVRARATPRWPRRVVGTLLDRRLDDALEVVVVISVRATPTSAKRARQLAARRERRRARDRACGPRGRRSRRRRRRQSRLLRRADRRAGSLDASVPSRAMIRPVERADDRTSTRTSAAEWRGRRPPRFVERRGRASRPRSRPVRVRADLGCGAGLHLADARRARRRARRRRGDARTSPARPLPTRWCVRADLEALPFRAGALGGAWARASYLHVPARPAPARAARAAPGDRRRRAGRP